MDSADFFERAAESLILVPGCRYPDLAEELAVDSIDALVDTCRQVWDIFCGIFKECIASGDIFVRYKECWGPDEYFWQVKIPGLCNFKGEGKVGARIASEFLVGFAGVPREKIG